MSIIAGVSASLTVFYQISLTYKQTRARSGCLDGWLEWASCFGHSLFFWSIVCSIDSKLNSASLTIVFSLETIQLFHLHFGKSSSHEIRNLLEMDLTVVVFFALLLNGMYFLLYCFRIRVNYTITFAISLAIKRE